MGAPRCRDDLPATFHGVFAALQVLNQLIDALDGYAIKSRCCRGEFAGMSKSLVELLTLVAHGSPRWTGRERAALSVIDSCQWLGDDGLNATLYAWFPT
jgi:hypothetical protein